jgi:hypothetical protein
MNENAAVEELAFIKNIIKESRKSYALSGKPYIFWGILIVVGLFLEYLRGIDIIDFDYMFFVWIILIGIGWGYAYHESKKHKRESKTISLAGKILGGVWLACGVSMTIFGFLGTISGAIKGVYVSPVLSLVLAIAYFVTGVVYDYKWQRNLSIGWWAGAIFMFFFPGEHTNLIMALMMIGLQIVPGIILLNKVKALKTTEA